VGYLPISKFHSITEIFFCLQAHLTILGWLLPASICPLFMFGHLLYYRYALTNNLELLTILNSIQMKYATYFTGPIHLHMLSWMVIRNVVNLALYAPSCKCLSPEYCSPIYLFLGLLCFLLSLTNLVCIDCIFTHFANDNLISYRIIFNKNILVIWQYKMQTT